MGAVLFIVTYIVAAILLVPGAALTLAAGSVYGLGWGIIYVSIGSVLGAAAPFLITRLYARNAVIKRFGRDPRVRAIDDAVNREGWRVIVLTRLSPLLPYNLLNYALGLSNISFRQYFFWSWIGMMPGTILYVYIGAAAGRLAGTGEEAAPQAEKIAFWFGIAATVLLTLYLSRLTKRALRVAQIPQTP